MVLDSKHMDWASREGLDTAALKRAKVPIFGKWYFPDLPDNVPLVNLSTGEVESFPAGYRAGAVLYVKEEDLKRAGLGPYKAAAAAPAAPASAAEAPAGEPVAVAAATPPQPVLTQAGSGQASAPVRPAAAPAPAPAPAAHAPAAAAHMPTAVAHAAPAHEAPAHHAPAHGDAHAHPGPGTYITIALILTVITAVEVAVYYIPALLPYIFPILIVLSTVKFVLVVGWFMHLKFDHVSYTWYFGGGLALALSIFGGLILLQIATHGLPPGDGNARTYPATIPGAPGREAPSPGAGH